MTHFAALVELALAIWVAYDASKLGARRGRLGGGILDMGPVAWFFCCFLCFIVGIVCYLVTRPKLVAAGNTGRAAPGPAPAYSQFGALPPRQVTGPPVAGYPGAGQVAPAVPALPAQPRPVPPAGWYPDPGGTAASRWWDGTTWTAHTT